jgi:hypothetical protein
MENREKPPPTTAFLSHSRDESGLLFGMTRSVFDREKVLVVREKKGHSTKGFSRVLVT